MTAPGIPVTMMLPPLVERDLRVAMRKYNPRRWRFLVTCGGAAITGLTILLSRFFPSIDGQLLHLFLFGFSILAGVSPLMAVVSAALAEERSSAHLGSLFLAGLTPVEVLVGKLAGLVLLHAQFLLCWVPFFAVPFLLGGISFSVYLASLVSLAVLFFFAICACTLAAAFTKDAVAGQYVAYCLIVGLCGITPLVYHGYKWFSPGSVVPQIWLLVSPACGPVIVGSRFTLGTLPDFYLNCGIVLVLSGLMLWVAGRVIIRVWKDDYELVPWKVRWREWLRGDARARAETSRRWLDQNPAAWLAARDRKPVLLAWALVWGYVILWLVCWVLWPLGWPGVVNFFASALILFIFLSQTMVHATGKCIAEARRDGGLELLLTTPLTVEQIVDGQIQATWRRFVPVWLTLIALDFIMLSAGLALRPWTTASLYVYFMGWALVIIATCWPALNPPRTGGLWAALNLGRIAPPVSAWWMGLMIYQAANLFRIVTKGPVSYQFPEGNNVEMVIVTLLGVIALFVIAGLRFLGDECQERLIKHFRDIAQEPLPEVGDPRMTKWQANAEYPLAWEPSRKA
ncbi:MAG: ABC transporter permease [Verrucomicrobiota bacterium]